MHITEKISIQMKQPFVSTECTYLYEIRLSINKKTQKIDFLLSFVYDHEMSLLHLLFKDVSEFHVACNDKSFERHFQSFFLGEFLFYDEENGTPIHVGDELGNFSLICNDVEFIRIEDMRYP